MVTTAIVVGTTLALGAAVTARAASDVETAAAAQATQASIDAAVRDHYEQQAEAAAKEYQQKLDTLVREDQQKDIAATPIPSPQLRHRPHALRSHAHPHPCHHTPRAGPVDTRLLHRGSFL